MEISKIGEAKNLIYKIEAYEGIIKNLNNQKEDPLSRIKHALYSLNEVKDITDYTDELNLFALNMSEKVSKEKHELFKKLNAL